MLTCGECGAPVHRVWEYCKRCGADLPARDSAEEEGPRLVPSFSMPRLPWERLSQARDAVPSGASARAWLRGRLPEGAPGISVSGLRERARRVGELRPGTDRARLPDVGISGASRAAMVIAPMILLAAMLVGFGAGSFFNGGGAAEARSEAADARQSELDARTEIERLNVELAQTSEALAEAEREVELAQEQLASLRGQVTGGEHVFNELRREVLDLREDLSQARDRAEESHARISEQQHSIEILSECLGGTEVALAFAMDGRSASAVRRALEAVQDVCAVAETLP